MQDKENCGKSVPSSAKSRHSPTVPLRDSGNLSVTLTLSSEAAQDIVGVLKNLATVLNIPPPASYKITDRIPSPNKINPFGNKYNDDLEEGNQIYQLLVIKFNYSHYVLQNVGQYATYCKCY